MNWRAALPFREVWLVDFEFGGGPGERPVPRCLVAHELLSGRRIRVWEDELLQLDRPPYGVDSESLLVGYYASAEVGCHLALGWPVPQNVLDLFVEFRNHTNGTDPPCGNGLLGALAYFGVDTMMATEKEAFRQLALRGGPWSGTEQVDLLDYCATDVIALADLLSRMIDFIDLPRALLRGRYMVAAARMEHAGVPIDTDALSKLRIAWPDIKGRLVQEVDRDFGVYDGDTFRQDRFAA